MYLRLGFVDLERVLNVFLMAVGSVNIAYSYMFQNFSEFTESAKLSEMKPNHMYAGHSRMIPKVRGFFWGRNVW